MGVPKMANREVCNVLFCEYKTKKPFLNMDYANVSTAEVVHLLTEHYFKIASAVITYEEVTV